MKQGVSLQISKEATKEGESIGLSPELVAELMSDGWSIDNIEHF